MSIFIKDKDATLDFGIDWTNWLESGEILTSSDWQTDLTIESSEYSSDGRTLIWLSGGDVGKTYKATNRIQTSLGRIDDRTIFIKIVER